LPIPTAENAKATAVPDRIVRDELLTSERYWQCSPEARNLYLSIILSADDLARYTGSVFALRSRCMAGTVSAEIVGKLKAELVAADLIRPYQVDGKDFLFIPRFRQRQRHVKRSRYPEPPNAINDQVLKKSDVSRTLDGLKTGASTAQVPHAGADVGVGVGVGVIPISLKPDKPKTRKAKAREAPPSPAPSGNGSGHPPDPTDSAAARLAMLRAGPTLSRDASSGVDASPVRLRDWRQSVQAIVQEAARLRVRIEPGRDTWGQVIARIEQAQAVKESDTNVKKSDSAVG
jgi:hypothetical protein